MWKARNLWMCAGRGMQWLIIKQSTSMFQPSPIIQKGRSILEFIPINCIASYIHVVPDLCNCFGWLDANKAELSIEDQIKSCCILNSDNHARMVLQQSIHISTNAWRYRVATSLNKRLHHTCSYDLFLTTTGFSRLESELFVWTFWSVICKFTKKTSRSLKRFWIAFFSCELNCTDFMTQLW